MRPARPLDLDAIEKRAEAATPGEWRRKTAACDHLDSDEHTAIKGGGRLVTVCVEEDADAEFIAHASTDVPALVAEVRALTAQLQAAREDVREAGDWMRGYAQEISSMEWAMADVINTLIEKARALLEPVATSVRGGTDE